MPKNRTKLKRIFLFSTILIASAVVFILNKKLTPPVPIPIGDPLEDPPPVILEAPLVMSSLVPTESLFFGYEGGGNVVALNRANLGVVWRRNIAASPLIGSPAIADGKVIALGVFDAFAFRQEDGSLVWQRENVVNVPRGNPVIDNGVVYIAGGSNGVALALNINTGETIWETDTDDEYLENSFLQARKPYFNGASGIYALDPIDGKQVWHLPSNFPVGKLVGDGENIYALSGEGKVWAIEGESGKVVWSRDLSRPGSIAWQGSTPLLSDGIIYVNIGQDGNTFALQSKNGNVIWGSSLEVANYKPPLVAGNRVFVSRGEFFALDKDTGKLAWKLKIGPGEIVTESKVYKDILYIGTDKKVIALRLK